MIELVPARSGHVNRLANDMRAVDRVEVEAFGNGPKQALRLALAGSPWALTAMDGESPVAMLGVAAVSSWLGRPWLLGTERVYSQRRALLALGEPVIAEMSRAFPILENWVSVGNERALRLLPRWGFTVEHDVELIGGVGFHRFWKAR